MFVWGTVRGRGTKRNSGRRRAETALFGPVNKVKQSWKCKDQNYFFFQLTCTSLMAVWMITLHFTDPSSIFREQEEWVLWVSLAEKYELFTNNFIIVRGRNRLSFIFTDRCRFVLCFSWTNILNATFCFWVTKIDVPSSPPANTESELVVSVPSTEQRHWGIQDGKAVASTRLRFEHQEWHLEDKPVQLMWEASLPFGAQRSAPVMNIWTAWGLQILSNAV